MKSFQAITLSLFSVFAIISSSVTSASADATAQISLLHSTESYEAMFIDHIAKFNLKIDVTADADEYYKRLAIYSDNSDVIELHNSAEENTYSLGHNELTHLSFEEFKNIYLTPFEDIPKVERSRFVNAFEDVIMAKKVPDAVDWTAVDGAVSEVKNQGSCGSCWSFSTTGSMEGAYFISHSKPVSFSEQELVSCDKVDLGCNGGLMDNAFQYIEKNGLCTEEDYPYTSAKGGKASSCEISACKAVRGTSAITYTDVAKSEDSLAAAVTQQPVSVAVDADRHWQMYRGGVMTHVRGKNLDHGVLLVGFGTDEETGTDFWKIKNSWGPSFGEEGYIRIKKGTGNPCGITSAASYPTFQQKNNLRQGAIMTQ